jgi:hypothetical protein
MWEGFPLETRDPQLAERIRERFRTVASGIFAAAFLFTAVSAFIAWKIPYSRDLYHLLYANGAPKREDTYMFLFVFPCFLWAIALLLWFDPGGLLQKKCRDDERAIAACVWNVAGASLFAVLALLRDADTWHHYF